MDSNDQNARDKYRDNDDARGIAGPDDRVDTHPDTRFEARGDARDDVGNTAHHAAAGAGGAQHQGRHDAQRGNDRQHASGEQVDDYDRDLANDNRRGKEPHGMEELARETRSGLFGAPGAHGDTGHAGVQHARTGQAESPAERTHNEPEHHKQGHGSRTD